MPFMIPEVSGIKIAIDRGGTFTDVLGIIPGQPDFVCKLLSVDPSNYPDATIEGIRRVLSHAHGQELPRNQPLDSSSIESIRMGTTVATNALLERKGTRCAVLVTKGFRDLLEIGDQTRPKLFDLNIRKPGVLHSRVVEVNERVTLEAYAEDPNGDDCLDSVNDDNLRRGVTGEVVRILEPLDVPQVTQALQELYDDGYQSIAVCLAHGYNFQDHEQKIGSIAAKIGFSNISLSSSLLPMINMVSRGQSAAADAYLTPITRNYVNQFIKGFQPGFEKTTRCEFMQSDGGLVSYTKFNGLRAVLSGPAGGVVGYARTSYDENEKTPVIGFDMGGTSTDCSRYGGQYEHVFESVTAGIRINCAQLDINTVAAGGGSILFWRNGLFVVGPESAGAHPGPVCYRKGGPLTVTDANLILGRLLPDYFPKIFGPEENESLGVDITRKAFEELAAVINAELAESGKHLTVEEIALGFLNVANINMAKPIRALTEMRGFDTTKHNLASFGGAGGQHACDIAASLGIGRVIIHRYSSILSAYGMALADLVCEAQEPSSKIYTDDNLEGFQQRTAELKKKIIDDFAAQGIDEGSITYETYLNMRYQGSNSKLMVRSLEGENDYLSKFKEMHHREFSYTSDRDVIVDDIRVRGIGNRSKVVEISPFEELKRVQKKLVVPPETQMRRKIYFQQGWLDTPIYQLDELNSGDLVEGPAMIIDKTQTIVVVPNAMTTILSRHVIIDLELSKKKNVSSDEIDPIHLSIFGHRFMSIAEDMGRTLQKISVSTNVKERLDFSCALFDSDGGLTANAPHVPVHLGSMADCVRIARDYWKGNLEPGDVIATNHPSQGGTHLPDITIISPVFGRDGISFYVASRAHHAEIGGIAAGSMPSNSTELWQEGAAFEQWKIISKGVFDDAGIKHHFVDVPGSYEDCSPTRCLRDNIADLKAQIAANQTGINLIQAMFEEYDEETVLFYMQAVKKTAEIAVRQLLRDTAKKFAGELPLRAVDHMDDGTAIKLAIDINSETGDALFDFTGTGLETYNSFNAPAAVTRSAILYVLRCLIGIDIPLNQGCLAPITINIPPGTLLNPSPTAAVCAGNGPTAQRITDVLIKAFRACAASSGDMSFVSFGIGGLAKNGTMSEGFGFGEALAGGSGAGPGWNGTSGVQIHMTNTKITDPEVLEKRYPVILHRFEIRKGSGGQGEYYGGDGLIREIEYRIPVHASVLTQRRVYAPYGMAEGEEGSRGENLMGRKQKDGTLRWVNVGGTKELKLNQGDRLRIASPGGGGYGRKQI